MGDGVEPILQSTTGFGTTEEYSASRRRCAGRKQAGGGRCSFRKSSTTCLMISCWFYTPSGLHLFLHNDGRSRLTTTRVRTSCTLKIGSGQKAMGWREAEHAVFRKCQQIGQFIATLTTWDDRVLQALQERTQSSA